DLRLLAVYANTLIFVIVGILITVHLSTGYEAKDTLLVFVTYIFLTFLRGIMIAIFYPILKRTGYGLTWKESIILSWGGLRGAVGLALALMFALNPKVDKSETANKVLVQVAGVIILTLIINANTIKLVMKLIRFKDITLVHRLSMGNAIACVTEIREKSLRICKSDWKYRRADWIWLLQKTKIIDPYKGGLYGDDPKMGSLFIPYGTCDDCMSSLLPYSPSMEEMNDLNEAARKKILRAMKGFFWKQFRNGLIQRRTLKFLSVAVDNASDIQYKYLKTEDVSSKFVALKKINHCLERSILRLLARIKLKESSFDREMHELRSAHRSGFRKFCSHFYFSWWLEPLTFIVIILNIIQVILDIYFVIHLDKKEFMEIIRIPCALFSLFYVLEISIKIITLGLQRYLKSILNKIDLVLSLIAVIEGSVDFFLMSYYPSKHSYFSHIRILIALRLFRIVRVLRMFDYLAEFEQEFPAVSFALKSNRAARQILNRLKRVLERCSERSLVLREDMELLKTILFKMTKKVVYAPRFRPVISDSSKILEECVWIKYAGASNIILENHTICSYTNGEVIVNAGNNHQFVYIIASGIVKVLYYKTKSKISLYEMYNELPNTDTFLIFDSTANVDIWEFLVPSQTLGLLGYLQKTKSVTTAICEKDCELIQVNYSVLKSAEEEYHLSYSMWRIAAIKVAVPILKQQTRYKDFTDQELRIRLQNAVLPSMVNVISWEVPPVIHDMVLVQGKAKDALTTTKFTGPSYIPNTYRKLIMLDDIKKRPLIVILLLPVEKCHVKPCKHWINLEEIEFFKMSKSHKTAHKT
ncbi:hypothetical protein CDAR_176551, partial [Caerostris darwini]